MAENSVQLRYYGVIRRTDNRVKVGPDLGGRKHKSPLILYFKQGPKFKEKTLQQKVVKRVGEFCGDIIRGKFEGKGDMWVKRKRAYTICTRYIFEKAGHDLSKVPDVLNENTRREIEEKLSKL